MKKSWLQGGPFLEVSFLHSFEGNYREFVVNTLNRLKNHLKYLEICVAPNELETLIFEFEKGYPFDEQTTAHVLELPTYLEVSGKRLAIFRIDQISSGLLKVEFSFYGSSIDVPEWQMIGIKDKDFSSFKYFAIDLFKEFKFDIGSLAFEENVIGLFSTKEYWPHESYNFDNLRGNSGVR